MGYSRKGLTVAAALLLALGPAAVAAAATPDATGYNRCASGKFCLFNGADGTGQVCQFPGSDRNTFTNNCFLKNEWKVRSVWNRTSVTVQYFKNTGYNDLVGSTQGGGNGIGNLAGTYTVGSVLFNSL